VLTLRRPLAVLAFLILVEFGCGLPERPKIVVISKASVFRPSSPKEVQTAEQAMAAIITVCRDDLGLPVVDPLYIHLYRNTASFAFYGKGWTTLPFDVANIAAFANENKLHVNLEKLGKLQWGPAIWLLAHEYGHNVHYSLGGAPRSIRWFAEGFAEWVAAKVVDGLGWQNYETTSRRAQRQLDHHRDIIPGLSSVRYYRDWESLVQKPNGWVRTYNLAFLAVDRFIEKKGLQGVIEYMKSGDFKSSFGESEVAYQPDLGISGRKGNEQQQNKILMRKPEWKVGYEWMYEERLPGRKSKEIVKKIIIEDSKGSVPVFVVKVDDEEHLYSRETLGLFTTMKNGKETTSRDKPNQFFAWPLEVSKEWRNTYSIQNLDIGTKGVIDRLMVVEAIGEITISAGTFKTAKIEAYDNKSGRLVAEYWYSPGAKWFVKTINYDQEDGFVREQELRSFKVDP